MRRRALLVATAVVGIAAITVGIAWPLWSRGEPFDLERVDVELTRPDLPHAGDEPLTVRLGFAAERFEPGEQGTVEVGGIEGATGLVRAEDSQGRLVGLGMLPQDRDLIADPGPVRVDLASTAFALVLMNPPLLTVDPAMVLLLAGLVGDLEAFDDLVAVLADEAAADPAFLDDPPAAVAEAVGEVIAELGDRLDAGLDAARAAGLDDRPGDGLAAAAGQSGAANSPAGPVAVPAGALASNAGPLLASSDAFWQWATSSDLADLGACGALRAAPGEDRDGICWRSAQRSGGNWALEGANLTPRWGMVYDVGGPSAELVGVVPGRNSSIPQLGRLLIDASTDVAVGLVEDQWNRLAAAIETLPIDYHLERRPGTVERVVDRAASYLEEQDFDLTVRADQAGVQLAVHGFGQDLGVLLRSPPPSSALPGSVALTALDSALVPVIAAALNVAGDTLKEYLTDNERIGRIIAEVAPAAADAYEGVRRGGGAAAQALWDLVLAVARAVTSQMSDLVEAVWRVAEGEAASEVALDVAADEVGDVLDAAINSTGIGAAINLGTGVANIGLNVYFLAAAWDALADSAYYSVGAGGGDLAGEPELVRVHGDPNDPEYRVAVPQARSAQWALRSLDPATAWSVPEVREPDPGVRLLVLDTGVADHEDLVVRAARADGVQPRAGAHPEQPGHGTRVAGIAAAATDNALGLAAPAWDQAVDSYNVFYGPERAVGGLRMALDLAGVSYDPATGEVEVAEEGDRVVVNMSYTRGTGGLDPLESELLEAGVRSGRVLWVASAGNADAEADDGHRVAQPAAHPATLAVGAGDRDGGLASFSRRGPEIDLLAPGEAVLTTDPERGYAEVAGVSYATPFVSGAAVALWKAEPQLTAEQVRKRLLAAGGEPRGEDHGHGLLDLRRLMTVDREPPGIELTQLGRHGEVAFRVEVSDDTEPLGLDRLAGVDPAVAGAEALAGQLWASPGAIPTSSVTHVRWAIDDGPWNAIDVDATGTQAYLREDGSVCQVCAEVSVPASQLGFTGTHHLRVRAWDSALSPAEAPYAERIVTLNGPLDVDVADLDLDEDSGVVIVLDVSGSMGERLEGGTRMDAARTAAEEVLVAAQAGADLEGNSQVALVTFSDGAQVVTPATTDIDRVAADLATTSPGGFTNVGEGLDLALTELAGIDGRRSVILLSDGEANRGLSEREILDGPAQQASAEQIPVHTVFFGDDGGPGEALMIALARQTGGLTATAGTPAELQEDFLRADHARGGVVLLDERTDEASIALPRGSASLRVTALSLDGEPAAIDVISPSGLRARGEAERREHGATSVASLVVPQPEAGDWVLEADREVALLVSAMPSAEAVERLDQVRDDPDPPPLRLAPSEGEIASGWPVPTGAAGVLGLWLLGGGLASMAVGGVLYPLAGRPPRRGWVCAACGSEAPRRARRCGACSLPRGARAALDVVEGPEAGQRLLLSPEERLGGGGGGSGNGGGGGHGGGGGSGDGGGGRLLADGLLVRSPRRLAWRDGGWVLLADTPGEGAGLAAPVAVEPGVPVAVGLHQVALAGTVDARGRATPTAAPSDRPSATTEEQGPTLPGAAP